MKHKQPRVITKTNELIEQLFHMSLPLFFIMSGNSLVLVMDPGVVVVVVSPVNLQPGKNLVVKNYSSKIKGNKEPGFTQMQLLQQRQFFLDS